MTKRKISIAERVAVIRNKLQPVRHLVETDFFPDGQQEPRAAAKAAMKAVITELDRMEADVRSRRQ